jgi:hypothetical protein
MRLGRCKVVQASGRCAVRCTFYSSPRCCAVCFDLGVWRCRAKAKANGGGVVMLPRGQYYVDGPLIVPEGTRLVGEGTNLVSIFFREDNPDTAPRPGYIHANNSATAWAVEDLSVYVTHYYYSVFYVQPTCKDWTLKNVRVRAVAWAMISDPVLGNNGRGGRLANFSRGQVGEVIYLDGNTNYKIVENDLLATGIVIHTGGHGFNNGGSAMNGIVARNTLWNANAVRSHLSSWVFAVKIVCLKPGLCCNCCRRIGSTISSRS